MKKTILPYLQSWFLTGMLILASMITGSAQETDYSKTLPQNVFPTPILNPMADKTWGEPAIAWHEGEYFLIYDMPVREAGPACLMTSRDGVYWREEGAVLWPDPGEGCIECPDLHRYQPDGPFVLSWDAHPDGEHVRRFAVSDDLRNWKKLDHVFRADERYYREIPFYNQYAIPNPEGGWHAVLSACPHEFVGLGLGRSRDGIHWECLPPMRVEGVIDHRGGMEPGPGAKAMETSAFLELDGSYFIMGGNPATGSDIIVSSKDIRGPYKPTPRNHMHMRTPQIFQRAYILPDGWLSMPMVWAQRERRYYHVAPFRSVVTDGESLWFTWWEGNEKLKVHPLPASVAAPAQTDPALRMLEGAFDLEKGLVLEATVPLDPAHRPERNLALDAEVSATSEYTRSWWPEGYFSADRAADDRESTSWRGHRTETEGTVEFSLDLKQVRDIGRIEAKWLPPPQDIRIFHSPDGVSWQKTDSPYEKHFTLPAHQRWVWEDLDLRARYLRLELTPYPRRPGGREVPVTDHYVGISEIGVYAEPRERLPQTAAGLVLKTADGEGYAWLVERNGRVRFGKLSGGFRTFYCERTRDLEVDFGKRADIRLIQRGDLVDLYVNDYQVDYYQLKGELSGEFGLLTGRKEGRRSSPAVRAWRPDPLAADNANR